MRADIGIASGMPMGKIETLISDLGNTMTGNRKFDPDIQVGIILKCFTIATEKIKLLFENSPPHSNMSKCVFYYQLEISSTLSKADLLMSSIDSGHLPLTLRKKYRKVLWVLIKRGVRFLDFLRTRFPGFFDHAMAIPEVLYPFYMPVIHRRWHRYRKIWSSYLDYELVKLLDSYFKAYRDAGSREKIRWKDLSYMDTLSQELEWLAKTRFREELPEELVKILFRLNFNHPGFFAYYVKNMCNRAAKVDTYLQEQREWLDCQHEFTAMIVRQDIGYDMRLKDVKSQLNEYIVGQIRYVKKKEKLHRANMFVKWGRAANPFYFHVSMTVIQLIFLFRLFMEAGYILVKNRKDFNEFITNHVGTLRKDNISIKSIESKYIRPDKKTVDKVSTILITMLNLLNAKYKEKSK